MTLFSAALAAAVLVSPSGDFAEVKLTLATQDRAAAHAAIGRAARQACRAVAATSDDYAFCVSDARRRGVADFRRAQSRKPLLVSAQR